VITVHHHHFGVTVWTDGMIGEPDFVSLTSSVHDKVIVKIEQEAAHVLVVNFSPAVRLVLRNDLSTVFANEFILFARHLDIDAPASHIRGGKQKMLSLTALKADIPTGNVSCSIKGIGSTCLTEVWVTFSDR